MAAQYIMARVYVLLSGRIRYWHACSDQLLYDVGDEDPILYA